MMGNFIYLNIASVTNQNSNKVLLYKMSTLRISHTYLFSILILVLFLSCNKEPTGNIQNQIEDGSWTIYSPYKWSHDGQPYTSDYCTVYSDGANYDLKERVGKFSDTKLLEIVEMFNFNNHSDFLYPPENDKINVYINKNHEEGIAAAYWGTIIITIRTNDFDTSRYDYLFKHELTHEFEFLIEGTVNLGTDVWFREGIAIYCGGGLDYIKNNDDLHHWISINSHYPNQGNFITIHSWEDFPEGSDKTGYYTVFDVVMKYILDSNGLGRSIEDVLNLFYEVRNGVNFPNAFQNNVGISLSDLENEIFDRLHLYLYEN
jgi:hypothetical protein